MSTTNENMAPLRQLKPPAKPATRSRCAVQPLRAKRKADGSPTKGANHAKRTAMCDITNAKGGARAKPPPPAGKLTKRAAVAPTLRTAVKAAPAGAVAPHAPAISGIVTRAALKSNCAANQTALKAPTGGEKCKEGAARVKTRLSNEFEKTEESLYSSALEELSDSVASSRRSGASSRRGTKSETVNLSFVAHELETKLNLGNHEVPPGVDDFDKENWDDPYQVSHYAMDIFNYLKSVEKKFDISDYMDRQVCLTPWMRSLLVDWMVEVQESFELNHETLYLGVKLVDSYLSRVTVSKETLQLVGAAAMFVASKYDERIPPMIDDFLYICDGAYSRRELIRMEINLLKVCDFNLGIPLSYRFLRRYARCAKITMPVLTLARFVLEYSLMDYTTVTVLDTKLASASLYLALRMKKISGWTNVLEFYTGYKLSDFMDTVVLLNDGLHKKPKSPLMTVRNKYSHKIFFEVAKTPLLRNEDLSE